MEFRKMIPTILHGGRERRHRCKEQLLDSVEGKGGMIWENTIKTYSLPYVKQMTSASLVHKAGHPKPVLWDNPEG